MPRNLRAAIIPWPRRGRVRPSRVDGVTPRRRLGGAVHSAGSQLCTGNSANQVAMAKAGGEPPLLPWLRGGVAVQGGAVAAREKLRVEELHAAVALSAQAYAGYTNKKAVDAKRQGRMWCSACACACWMHARFCQQPRARHRRRQGVVTGTLPGRVFARESRAPARLPTPSQHLGSVYGPDTPLVLPPVPGGGIAAGLMRHRLHVCEGTLAGARTCPPLRFPGLAHRDAAKALLGLQNLALLEKHRPSR